MGRKRKGADLQDRIDKYLDTYELDDLNSANDMAALTQMCQLEVNIERIQEALSKIDYGDKDINSRKIRELHSALRDANQNWVTLQTELGINRRKRQSEDDETPLQYVEKLQSQAKKFIDSRFVKLVCPTCGQLLAKYFIYVPAEGEEGSINSTKTSVRFYKYGFKCECWKCGAVAEASVE